MSFQPDYKHACKNAQANADYFKMPYVVFQDTSGNWRSESQSIAPKNLGYEPEVFYPKEKS